MNKNKKIKGILIVLLVAILLTACAGKPTEDPNLRITEIASTVQAELTMNAALTPSATATTEPTATATLEPPTPTVGTTLTTAAPTLQSTVPVINSGDNSLFLGDVNYPDGTVVLPGTKFTKTWKFRNNGQTTWTTGYSIVYLEGTLLGTNDVVIFKLTKEVAPGDTAEISAEFTAPAKLGRYTSVWKLYSAGGYFFGEYASIDITVGSSTPEPTTENTATPTSESPTITPTP